MAKIKEKELDENFKKVTYSSEFKDKIYQFILGETLKFALDNPNKTYDDIFSTAIKSSQNLEDVLAFLTLESATNEKLSIKILNGLTIAYL